MKRFAEVRRLYWEPVEMQAKSKADFASWRKARKRQKA